MTEVSSKFLPGDWECPACKAHNFRSRSECFKCNVAKDATKGNTVGASVSSSSPLDAEEFPPQSLKETEPAAAADQVKELYLTVDIERWGKQFYHGVGAIGACFGDAGGNIIEQKAFCSKVPPKDDFEKRTWDEFWSKHPDVLARIDAAAVPNALGAFKEWVLDIEKKHGPFGRKHRGNVKLKLISDNPAYDIGNINLELFKTEVADLLLAIEVDEKLDLDFLHRQMKTLGQGCALAELFDDYVATDDPSEQIRHMTPLQKQLVAEHVTAPHDHWPVNDATQIYQQRVGVKRVADATTVIEVKKGKTITFIEDCEVVYVKRSKLKK